MSQIQVGQNTTTLPSVHQQMQLSIMEMGVPYNFMIFPIYKKTFEVKYIYVPTQITQLITCAASFKVGAFFFLFCNRYQCPAYIYQIHIHIQVFTSTVKITGIAFLPQAKKKLSEQKWTGKHDMLNKWEHIL